LTVIGDNCTYCSTFNINQFTKILALQVQVINESHTFRESTDSLLSLMFPHHVHEVRHRNTTENPVSFQSKNMHQAGDQPDA